MFTAKHYVCLADVIHKARVRAQDFNPDQGELSDKNTALHTLAELTMDLIQVFKQDNSKFDQFKFVEACNKDLVGPEAVGPEDKRGPNQANGRRQDRA